MEESKVAPTLANHDGHFQRCFVAEVEFVESFYERFNNLNSSNMVKVDLDTATAQKWKEIKRTVSWKEWLLVSSLAGVFILKVWWLWSCLCCQELKPAIPVKRLKPSGILNLDNSHHDDTCTSLAPLLRPLRVLFVISVNCLALLATIDLLCPQSSRGKVAKQRLLIFFGTTLLDYPCRSRGFTLAFKKIFPIIISMRYSGSLDSEPYLTFRRYMDQGIYFQCL